MMKYGRADHEIERPGKKWKAKSISGYSRKSGVAQVG
jgi:hypothetical protein